MVPPEATSASPAMFRLITCALVVLLAACFSVPLTVRELIESSSVPVMVTVCPAAIVTSSLAPGTTPPTHVPVSTQLPVPAELIAAASTGWVKVRRRKEASIIV